MNRDEMALLYEYNYWADWRILDTAAKLTPEQFAAPAKYSRGGVRATLAHMLDGERTWRLIVSGSTAPRSSWATWPSGSTSLDVDEERVPTHEALMKFWREDESEMRAYVGGLKQADFTEIVRFTTDDGQEIARVRWHCLVHVVNHGTQHRSEVAALLTGYGHSPGDLDFTQFLDEKTMAGA
ncbi:MAG: DinB family protein [Anaerolineales bacterium]